MTDRSWCLFRVTTGQEFTASAALSERHIIHECPTATVEQVVKPRGRNARVMEFKVPALPGYLFLFLSAEEWNDLVDRPIKHIWATMQWLSRADILDMLNFIAKVRVMETIREYQPGDKIVDVAGMFGEGVLTFMELTKEKTIIAEAEMMGRSVEVEFKDPTRLRRA